MVWYLEWVGKYLFVDLYKKVNNTQPGRQAGRQAIQIIQINYCYISFHFYKRIKKLLKCLNLKCEHLFATTKCKYKLAKGILSLQLT